MYSVPEFNSERFSRESDIKRPDIKETKREGGNLQHKEWKALKQRVEQLEL